MPRSTLVFLHQRGCPHCKAWEPVVDAFEEELSEGFRVERIDISKRTVPYDAQIEFVPTFRLESSCGKVQMRTGAEIAASPALEPLAAFAQRVAGSCGRKKRR